jgi:aminoglycoside phosphotransferase (APT) family kinase protein
LESTTKVSLTHETIETLVRTAFGNNTKPKNIEELREGWYNTAYAMELSTGEKTVLKVSPPDDAAILTYEKDIMHTEVETMLLVKDNPEIPVPCIMSFDFSQTSIPNNYFFMEYIACPVWNDISKDLTEAQNKAILHQLGHITAHINSYCNDEFGYYALEPKYTTWMDMVLTMFHMLFGDAETYAVQLPITLDEVNTLLKVQTHHFAEIRQPRLVHWDLWQGNVFIDIDGGEPRICSVIDFERVFWGDPLLEAFFRRNGNQAFMEGYGQSMLSTQSQRVRNLFYDLYLYVIMVVEDGPRQYSDRGIVTWARKQLDETLIELKAL